MIDLTLTEIWHEGHFAQLSTAWPGSVWSTFITQRRRFTPSYIIGQFLYTHTTFFYVLHNNSTVKRKFTYQKTCSILSWLLLPWRALKPCRGTLEEPVTNCSSRALRSSSNDSTAFQNHLTILLSGVQCLSRVLDFQSLMSILPRPHTISYR